MKKIFSIVIPIMYILLFTTSCNSNYRDNGIYKDCLYFSEYNHNIFIWDFVSVSDGYVTRKSGNIEYKFGHFSYVSNTHYYWAFYPIKPGEFTICALSTDGGEWILIDESYAEDYIIDDNLEIHLVGNKRPIYEIEKYDKLLFEQFSGDSSLHLNWVLDDYPNIRYLITSDYVTRTIDILVYGSDTNNESELRQKIENRLDEHNQNLIEVMHDTKINITFEDSEMSNNSENE